MKTGYSAAHVKTDHIKNVLGQNQVPISLIVTLASGKRNEKTVSNMVSVVTLHSFLQTILNRTKNS
jgi:hypothetical protein